MAKIRAGIVGGTGYSGVELLRLLTQHPEVEIAVATSRQDAGKEVSAAYPSLRGRVTLAFTQPDDPALRNATCRVFFCTPNGVAMGGRALLDAGARIVDISADFRLKDVAEWERWYKMKHAAPDLVAEAVYGLCEVNRDKIRGARLVANPGCYPTSVLLGFLPLLEVAAVDTAHLIADAKSGVSGAGRKLELHLMHGEVSENFAAYGVGGHRHWPEMRQGLAQLAGSEVGLLFTPHLVPMVRGILATLYARVTKEMDFQALYEKRYANEPFVDVMPAGSQPDTRSTRAANVCRIAVHRPRQHGNGGDTLTVLSVIDNLMKGASGQAVQNMNLMFGLDESLGLAQLPVLP